MIETKYGISAEELHERIIESMRSFAQHMGWRLEDILERHDRHPLEQTITSCLWRVSLDERKKFLKVESKGEEKS